MSSGTASQTENPSAGDQRPSSRRWTARDAAQMLLFALLVKPFMTLFIGLRVRGREHLPSTGQFILVANHSSHLDTASLLTLFRMTRLRHIRPVAAADYFERNAFVSLLTKTCFNILPIARRGITAENNPIERMQQALAAGDSLIIFPEGTRGTGEDIGPFRSGIAHLVARLPDVPVVPAYLANMGRSLPKGEIIPVPFFCEIRLGEPLLLSGNRQQIIHTLEDAVRALKEMH
jgi:1-acyl-sn-glycerol-3-phosphate acyltransferase